ncbi:efflux RND transporter periplasmic adaptor subunit [Lichenibacterium minor]|uniref:Efflux RND transporter periplasmic adaptor subunit n=1 Tax=Lichenibacterium minor TaxID=2316528 RepID=A0A4V1RU75_9HYPH|nr:efflux RND transporter periplasmic adaptor subunit [Lichenibacterium minor]RYC30174.1 efflux RND transporter periplasmic adaptor subunit [Lichenibacterium minor]
MSPSPEIDPSRQPPRAGRVLLLLSAAAVGAVALAFFGIQSRARSLAEVANWTDAQAVPTVRVVAPQRGPGEDALVLPGTVSAFDMSSLYPRASGYVAAWHADIGARVTKGEVLATISAPDLDQQLAEAEAQLGQLGAAVQQAQANADLGQATDTRTARLVVQGWSSKEQGDTDRLTAASRTAALAVAKANVTTQEAVVGRLKELTRFEKIVAPFDGVVTARNVDVGDLVAAGGTSGKPLFQVADIHRMRVYVNVPQAYLAALKPGIAATLHLPGAKATVDAKLVTTSNAVAESSRTATVELDADNADGRLWPGAFAEVQFHIPSDPDRLTIPMTAVVFGAHGMQVAAVDGSGRVTVKPVELGRDLGERVQVESGLSAGDRLIDNPLESTQTGDTVTVADGPGKA